MASATKSKKLTCAQTTSSAYYTATVSFNETSTSTSSNTSTISVTGTLKSTNISFAGSKNTLEIYWYDNNQYSGGYLLSSTSITSFNAGQTLTLTGEVSPLHKNDGSLSGYAMFKIVKNKNNGFAPNTDSVSTDNTALTNIARVSILNSISMSIAPNGNSITITPGITKQNENFIDTLNLRFGEEYVLSFSNVTNNTSVYITDSTQLNRIYSYFGTSTSITVECGLTTYNGGTPIGSTTTTNYTLNLPSYSLQFGTPTVTDSVTTYNTKKNSNTDLIRYLSKPTIDAVAQSSTGSTYGQTISYKLNGTTTTFPKTINDYTGQNFSVSATDNRKTVSWTPTNTVIPYVKPTVTINVSRPSPTGNTANATITGTFYDGNGLKTSELLTESLTLKYTEQGGTEQTITSFTDVSTSTTNHITTVVKSATISGLDYKKSVNYNVVLSDKLGVNSNATSGVLPQGLPVWNAYTDANSDNHFNINGSLEINQTALIDLIYPVGSIYMSVNNVSPQTFFGGTWVAWGSGRVPVGVDTGQTEFNTVEKTGGSKYLQQHNHSLTTGQKTANWAAPYFALAYQYQAEATYAATTGSEGIGDSGNLQPYITCYMWKRTA